MPRPVSIAQSGDLEIRAEVSSGRRLLRLRAAAEYLSMSTGKLRALIQAGEIPLVKYGENAPWLVDIRDLDRWIEKNKTLIC
jgi:excisionase family DNA binding protein